MLNPFGIIVTRLREVILNADARADPLVVQTFKPLIKGFLAPLAAIAVKKRYVLHTGRVLLSLSTLRFVSTSIVVAGSIVLLLLTVCRAT